MYIYIYAHIYVYVYIFIYTQSVCGNLWIAAVSLFQSSSINFRSNGDLEGPDC